MTTGLQCFDDSGFAYFDTTTQAGRVLATVDIGAALSGSFTVPGLMEGAPFAVPLMRPAIAGRFYCIFSMPVVSFKDNTVSWTRIRPTPNFQMSQCSLIVGIS